MIFVTVGMHHQGFDRLISAMDAVAESLDEPVIMQIGAASYEPTHAEWFRFADGKKVDELIASARVVVGHAGSGTIITSFRYQRPLIVVPRRAMHNEHVDDHQLDLAQALAEQGKIYIVSEPTRDTLLEGISQAKHLRMHKKDGRRLAAAVSAILREGTAQLDAGTNSHQSARRKTSP